MSPNLVEENDCGNLFDQIDDLIKFPAEDECGGVGYLASSGDSKDIPSMWNASLPDADDGLFSGAHSDGFFSGAHSDGLFSVPYEDIIQLEWLSSFMEDSSEGMTLGKDNTKKETSPPDHFHTSSPVSVLESSSSTASSTSSSSGVKTMPPIGLNKRGPHRARSKRPRPPSFNPRPVIHLIPSSENVADSSAKITAEPNKKKKKASQLTPQSKETAETAPQAIRKCLHCEITKTPQWRSGPMGPKTLCNACGVRFKSGRLFPEYRPAASPTFIPALHSNSHKKVVEMRIKSVDPPAAPGKKLF